jgi:hypothetical protein
MTAVEARREPRRSVSLNTAEVARLIETGKQRGLIKAPAPAPVTVAAAPIRRPRKTRTAVPRIEPVEDGIALPVLKDGTKILDLNGVMAKWMDVTPDLAARWLKNNFGNRPVSDDTVIAYARDMIAGQWVPTHQGIAFNDKDELIDGQHRLLAVVKSGVSVRMMVTFNLPSHIGGKQVTTMDAVDRGRTRSVGDQLKIQHKMKDGTVIAGACATLANICYGERTRRLSVGHTLAILQEFEPAVLWVIERRSKQVGLRSTGVLGAFAFALMTEFTGNAEKPFWRNDELTPIAEMFEQLNHGDQFRNGSAIKKLRDFLTSPEAQLLTRSLDRGLAEVVLQAIDLELQGAEVEQLVVLDKGANAFRERLRDRVEKVRALFVLPEAAND